MSETWKPVPTWEGIYEVSDQGSVRSVDRVITRVTGAKQFYRGRIRSPYTKWDGHRTVGLKGDGRYEQHDVHILVLWAFVGPRPESLVGRHLNGDPGDNRLENLVWGTHSDNNLDQVRHGTHAEARRIHCANEHPLSGDNVRMRGNTRVCRQCERDAQRRCQARKRRRHSGVPA